MTDVDSPPKVKRIYVAGPMQGLPEHGYPAFDRAVSFLSSNYSMRGGYFWEPVSPHTLHDEDETTRGTKTHHEYMRTDIAALATCEAICLLDGWSMSKGACAELAAALAMGLEVWRYCHADTRFYKIS